MPGGELDRQIEAYKQMPEQLEPDHLFGWVVFHEEGLQGIFDDLQETADHSVRHFGRGPYLMRHEGEPPLPKEMLMVSTPIASVSHEVGAVRRILS